MGIRLKRNNIEKEIERRYEVWKEKMLKTKNIEKVGCEKIMKRSDVKEKNLERVKFEKITWREKNINKRRH